MSVLQSSIVERYRQNRLRPSSLHSDDYTLLDYGISLYERPANGFKFLEAYLGEDVFSNCIKAYYKNYKFSHPAPIDLESTFEKVSEQDLSWFFEDYIQGATGPDFSIQNLNENSVVVSNHSSCVSPCCSEDSPSVFTLFRSKKCHEKTFVHQTRSTRITAISCGLGEACLGAGCRRPP